MSSSAYYKKLNAQQALAVDQVQPLLEKLTCELSLSRPSDPISAMIARLYELDASLEQPPASPPLEEGEEAEGASNTNKSTTAAQDLFNVRTPRMIISFIGGPGCGKTVQTSMAAGVSGLILAPGELIKDAINGGRSKSGPVIMPDELRDTVLALVRNGQTVPTKVMTDLLVNRITQAEAAEEAARENADDSEKHIPRTAFLLDGYPRSIEQALALEEALGEVSKVVHLYCPPNLLAQRLTLAGVPAEDQQSRMAYYKAVTTPLLEYWKAKKKLVVVDGTLERNACSKNVHALLRE